MTHEHLTIDAGGAPLRSSCALILNEAEFRWVAELLTELTERELEVLRTICEGGPNEHLADRLCIAVPTLRTHMMRINQKLGAVDKADVVRIVSMRVLDGYRRGWLARATGRVVEMKESTGKSVVSELHDPHAKSSLAMTTGNASSGQ